MVWLSALLMRNHAMPELPEVEVICRGLRPLLLGRTFTAVQISGKALRHPVPLASMQSQLINQKVVSIERRAKYLQIFIESGAILVIHLGMTGNLGIFSPEQPLAKHDHVIWRLDTDTELRYNDSRRFGSVRLLSPEQAIIRENTIFKTTGPEPFSKEFNGNYLHQIAKNRNLTVKVFIMTSQVVAGVGNIYANESLFAAGIRPSCKVKSISKKRWRRLVEEIRNVLNHAIACGGSTISDYVNAGQEKGYFQMNFKIYGKNDENCVVCGKTIKKVILGGRASYYCPACQG